MKLSKRDSPGFTMIEVIAVLVILGIISAVAIAKVSSVIAQYNLDSEADVIKGHLRYAQALSMNSTVNWGITFSSGSYTIFTNPSSTVALPGTGSATATLPSGMTIATGTVSFDSWGTPYTDIRATSLQTGGPQSYTLSLGNNTVTIQIWDDTGLIP
jgi:prepilin-type N-terminal cleavage/methylation domain-containing protein